MRDLRRFQIVEAARRIVAEGGLEALTIGTLEKRLHFTRGVITYHFKDKDDIVHAVLASAVTEIDAAARAGVGEARSHAEKLDAVVSNMVKGFLGHAEASRILLSFWGKSEDARAARANAALFARYRADTERIVRQGQELGVFHRDAAGADVATLVVGIVIGIVCQAVFEPGAVAVDAAVAEGQAALRRRLLAAGREASGVPGRIRKP